jgi:hypothetical protein
MPFIGLSLSISFTRFISVVVARNCGNTTLRNFLIFLGMLATHYFLLALWVPISQFASAEFEQLVIALILGNRVRTISMVFINLFSRSHYLYLFLNSHVSLFYRFSFWESVTFEHGLEAGYTFFLLRFVAAYSMTVLIFLIAIIFVASFLLRPLIMKPLLLIWARIVESDKPVFTLTCAGISSLVVAANEMAKHLR